MAEKIDIKKILSDAKLRRDLMVRVIVATQAREGIVTTEAQAALAYDRVVIEREASIAAQEGEADA